ncbi:MAG TPA: hypothetical protein VFC63_23915 [Blastocatellia bacterium]|nr:hypothetical protein [Blastocatellia bacterium]
MKSFKNLLRTAVTVLVLIGFTLPVAMQHGSAFGQGRSVAPSQSRVQTPKPILSGKVPVTPKKPDPTASPRIMTLFGDTVDVNPLTNLNASSLVLPLGNDDTVEYDFQNGLVFPFFNTIYTKMFISANGYVTFGQPAFDAAPSLPALITGPPRLAVFWEDLNPAAAGSVTLTQLGDELLLVEWNGVADQTEATTKTDTFALVMARNGAFEYIYGPVNSASGMVGFSEGAAFFVTAQKVDFDQLASAPNSINISVPLLFEAFNTSSGSDITNSAVIFFNTDKRTDPGLESILRPNTLGPLNSSQTIFIEDPLGRFTKTAAVRVDGLAAQSAFINANQLTLTVNSAFSKIPALHLVDADFAKGSNYFTGLPLQVVPATVGITAVTPNAVQVGDSNVKVRIDGFGFMTGVKVIITDFAHGITQTVTPTLGIGPLAPLGTAGTSLSFTLPAAFLKNQADLFFSVVNVGNRTAITSQDFRTHLFVVRSPLFAVKQ